MKNTYCTLFNYDYLTRGLALYRSMERCIDDFRLYILAMDKETFEILEDQNLEQVILIYVDSIMDDRLKTVLGRRPGPSFFWTCTPLVIEYILKEKKEEWCTYVDADCYFLKDPGKVFDIIEEGNYSVGIVEHRFRKDDSYDGLIEMDGRFNVAFNTFRNEDNSLKILDEWKEQCINCCTNDPTDGNFGDQLYLNEWPDKHERVYIVEDDGVDVAPWNVNNYRFSGAAGSYSISNGNDTFDVSMYHFHAMRFLSSHIVSLNLWNTKSRAEEKAIFALYREYITELRKQQQVLDKYPQYFRIPEKKGILDRFSTLLGKYKNREENDLIGMIRNVMWI